MFACCECCVLSGTGLCDELITRPDEFYVLWCVVVGDLETLRMRKSWPALGRSDTRKKKPPLPSIDKTRTVYVYVVGLVTSIQLSLFHNEPVTCVGTHDFCPPLPEYIPLITQGNRLEPKKPIM